MISNLSTAFFIIESFDAVRDTGPGIMAKLGLYFCRIQKRELRSPPDQMHLFIFIRSLYNQVHQMSPR